MSIQLGSLSLSPVLEHPELLADPVRTFLSERNSDGVSVAEINAELSDTAAFCEHYQVNMNQAANCVVLEAKRAERSWFAACVILGSTRADINGVVRRTLDARKVSFAPMEEAVSRSGMEFGAITPVGLPADWSILIDKAVVDSEYVIIGSGIRGSKLAIPGKFLASLPQVQVIEGLAVART